MFNNKPFLSVIIPAYNEEKRIQNILLAVDKYLSAQEYEYEIIVVVDGAMDKTAEIVNKYLPLIHNLHLLNNEKNQGKGAVVAQGMLAAKGAIRVFTDTDNSTAIDHIEKFLPFFKDGFDIVIGSRRTRGSKIAVHQSFIKELAGRLGNFWIRIFAVGGIKDTQCGFKAFTEYAAEDIFKRLTIFRWGFDIEVLAVAKFLKYKIKEAPVVWINDSQSHVKASTYLQVLWETLKVGWNIIIGKYK